jgi:hypothetical protein
MNGDPFAILLNKGDCVILRAFHDQADMHAGIEDVLSFVAASKNWRC